MVALAVVPKDMGGGLREAEGVQVEGVVVYRCAQARR
jgi:hypothetical protein